MTCPAPRVNVKGSFLSRLLSNLVPSNKVPYVTVICRLKMWPTYSVVHAQSVSFLGFSFTNFRSVLKQLGHESAEAETGLPARQSSQNPSSSSLLLLIVRARRKSTILTQQKSRRIACLMWSEGIMRWQARGISVRAHRAFCRGCSHSVVCKQ